MASGNEQVATILCRSYDRPTTGVGSQANPAKCFVSVQAMLYSMDAKLHKKKKWNMVKGMILPLLEKYYLLKAGCLDASGLFLSKICRQFLFRPFEEKESLSDMEATFSSTS